MPLSIRTDSTEYVSTSLTANHDVTGTVVNVALPPVNEAPTTWYAAEVLSVTAVPGAARWVVSYRLLIGPAGGVTQLNPGEYDWTARLTDTPEVPIYKHAVLTVTLT